MVNTVSFISWKKLNFFSTSNPVLYSFFPNVSPGMKIIEKPNHLVFLPVTRTIDQVKIWLTDQNGNLLNLRNEVVTIRLQLRKIIK